MWRKKKRTDAFHRLISSSKSFLTGSNRPPKELSFLPESAFRAGGVGMKRGSGTVWTILTMVLEMLFGDMFMVVWRHVYGR